MVVFWTLVVLAAVGIAITASHFFGSGVYKKTEGFIETYAKEETEKEKEHE